MRTETLKLFIVITGAAIFNIIFWNEKPGINVIFFDVFISGCTFYLYPSCLMSRTCRWLSAAQIFTAVMVVIFNTVVSKIAFGVTLLLFVTFSQYVHRSVFYAGGSVFLNYIFSIPNFVFHLKNAISTEKTFSNVFRPVKFLLIPLMISGVFLIIYALGNTVFSDIASTMVIRLHNWVLTLLGPLLIERMAFFLFGLILISGLIFNVKCNFFSEADQKKDDNLFRKKDILKKWRENPLSDLLSLLLGKASKGILALKTEVLIGTISLLLVNTILFAINLLDFKYVWLNFRFRHNKNLSAYVHEGAGILIFSIIVAVLLLLFFFRGNVNFYKKNKRLKYAAYFWLLQNMFLVVSVVIRNCYYISHYGLTYKRIGLLFFLAMVISGLVTTFIKISRIKNTYYLLKANGWVAIIFLVLASTADWDVMIAKYNISRINSIPLDVPFLLSLSDRTLPIVVQHKELLITSSNCCNTYGSVKNPIDFLEKRKQNFLKRYDSYTWLSWNLADYETKRGLEVNNLSQKK